MATSEGEHVFIYVQEPSTYVEDPHTFLKSQVGPCSLFQTLSVAVPEQGPHTAFEVLC